MNIKEKTYFSIGLTVFIIIAYYYLYSFVELASNNLCQKYICFEFPSLAEVLAIYVAIIGLYFVVTSLDAWKQQDKYYNTKKSMEYITQINRGIFLISRKLNDFYPIETAVLSHEELNFIKSEFKTIFKDTGIFEHYNNLDRHNYSNNLLFETEVLSISNKLSKIIFKLNQDINELKEIENLTPNRFKGELFQIYNRQRNSIAEVGNEIYKLNTDIKDFSL